MSDKRVDPPVSRVDPPDALLRSGIAHMKDGQFAKGERLILAAFEGAAAPLPPDTPEPCPECGVAPNEPHAEGCFFLTGDPNDLRPAVLRVAHSDRKAGE